MTFDIGPSPWLQTLVFIYWALAFIIPIALTIYFFVLLSRMARAQEEMSRHMLEMARDIKLLAMRERDR